MANENSGGVDSYDYVEAMKEILERALSMVLSIDDKVNEGDELSPVGKMVAAAKEAFDSGDLEALRGFTDEGYGSVWAYGDVIQQYVDAVDEAAAAVDAAADAAAAAAAAVASGSGDVSDGDVSDAGVRGELLVAAGIDDETENPLVANARSQLFHVLSVAREDEADSNTDWTSHIEAVEKALREGDWDTLRVYMRGDEVPDFPYASSVRTYLIVAGKCSIEG